MITHEKIEEWIEEVKERPASAPNIIRYIAQRLSDLANRNEALLNENLALRLGKKVEEYECRIASLEYQLEILKRQISSGQAQEEMPESLVTTPLSVSLLVYNSLGQVLRFELDLSGSIETETVAQIPADVQEQAFLTRLLATSSLEELLFVFDSGRIKTAPVTVIPATAGSVMDWDQAYVQEPRGSEELSTILPIAQMSLAELCIQVSRKGYVKKMSGSLFESCVAHSFVGTGTKQKQDKTCSLVLCNKDDLVVLVSKEGRSFAVEANRLPITIEPVLQLGVMDHIVAAFCVREKPYLLFVTNSGKAVYREIQWLEQSNSFRTQGKPVFSKARREAGTWIVGAAAVDEKDWGMAISSDGNLKLYRIGDLFESGTLGMSNVVDFTSYGT